MEQNIEGEDTLKQIEVEETLQDQYEKETRNISKVKEGQMGETQVIQLNINRLQTKFSHEDLKFLKEAIQMGRTSQTHFTTLL